MDLIQRLPERVKDVGRRARLRVRAAAGHDVYVSRQVRVRTTRVGGRAGSGFGAWTVPIDALGADSVVYSVGIGDDISFDLDLIRRYGLVVHAFDPTPECGAWVREQDLPPEFVFHPLGLAARDGTASFFASRNADWIAHSLIPGSHTTTAAVQLPVRRLATLMRELEHDRIDLLKIDIEGAEYEVLRDLVESGADVACLLVEFHHRFHAIRSDETREAIARLNDAGFYIYDVSPRGSEYGFTRSRMRMSPDARR